MTFKEQAIIELMQEADAARIRKEEAAANYDTARGLLLEEMQRQGVTRFEFGGLVAIAYGESVKPAFNKRAFLEDQERAALYEQFMTAEQRKSAYAVVKAAKTA